METSINAIDGYLIVTVTGAVDRQAAGALYDLLVDCASVRDTRLVLDLSGVPALTHAGARGLIVAARMLRHVRGEMRIAGANDAVERVLKSLGFDHLLKLDPTRAASIAAISRAAAEAARRRPTRADPAPARRADRFPVLIGNPAALAAR